MVTRVMVSFLLSKIIISKSEKMFRFIETQSLESALVFIIGRVGWVKLYLALWLIDAALLSSICLYLAYHVQGHQRLLWIGLVFPPVTYLRQQKKLLRSTLLFFDHQQKIYCTIAFTSVWKKVKKFGSERSL